MLLIDSLALGDLTSITILGNTIVTVHTYEKAVELLDKKGVIYSSRLLMKMFALGGWSDNVGNMPYGSELRECRRMMTTEINHQKIEQFHAHQELSVRRLLRLILKRPEETYDHLEW